MSYDSRSRSQSPDDDDAENGDSPRGRRGGEKRKAETRQRGGKRSADCRVYVSNIPYEFKWQDLKDLFRTEVGDVAYVEMFTDDNGKPRGSAIVDFESADMARKAIDKMHRMEAKGRKLVVKGRDEIMNSRDFKFLFGSDRNRLGRDMDNRLRGGSSNRGGSSSQDISQVNYGNTYGLSVQFLSSLGITGPLGKRIFIANLDYKVGDEDLRDAFKVAGNVVSAEVIKDNDGKSRGFGVVEYDHPLQAVQAISMLHNQQYFDRRINVRLDMMDKKSKESSSSKLPKGLKGLGMGLGANGEAITDVSGNFSVSTNLMPSASNQMGGGGGGGMGGVGAFNMGSSSMSTGLNPQLPVMGMGGMDNMGMGGSNMGLGGLGASNVFNLASALQTMASASGFGPQQGLSMSSMQSMQSPNGAGPMFTTSASSNYTSNQSSNDYSSDFGSNRSVVKISNLPFDYTWKNLKDMCRNLGDIKFAEIKSKGTGLVRFSTEAEARRTADMLDRQRFDGRVLEASIV